MSLKCRQDCMLKIGGREIGFAKGQIIDDPEIIEAVKGHRQFVDPSAPVAAEKSAAPVAEAPITAPPAPPVIPSADETAPEPPATKKKTKKKKGDK